MEYNKICAKIIMRPYFSLNHQKLMCAKLKYLSKKIFKIFAESTNEKTVWDDF